MLFYSVLFYSILFYSIAGGPVQNVLSSELKEADLKKMLLDLKDQPENFHNCFKIWLAYVHQISEQNNIHGWSTWR